MLLIAHKLTAVFWTRLGTANTLPRTKEGSSGADEQQQLLPAI